MTKEEFIEAITALQAKEDNILEKKLELDKSLALLNDKIKACKEEFKSYEKDIQKIVDKRGKLIFPYKVNQILKLTSINSEDESVWKNDVSSTFKVEKVLFGISDENKIRCFVSAEPFKSSHKSRWTEYGLVLYLNEDNIAVDNKSLSTWNGSTKKETSIGFKIEIVK